MIVVALGKKGALKSALIRKLAYLRLISPTKPQVIYHDPGCQIVDGAGQVFTSANQARDFIQRNAYLPRLSIFRATSIEDVAKLAIDVHDVTLVLDELDQACEGKRWKSPSVRHLVHYGRHERVDLFGTFRSTRNVHEDLLGQADYVFLLKHSMSGYYDLLTISLRYGPEGARAVRSLKKGQFIIWSDD